MQIIQTYRLNVVPTYWVRTNVNINQGDVGMTVFQFELWNRMKRIPLTGLSGRIQGKKEDGTTFDHACETMDDGSEYGVVGTQIYEDMSDTATSANCELSVSDESGVAHTANFVLNVEVSAENS